MATPKEIDDEEIDDEEIGDEKIGFPAGNDDERELLLSWLGYLRGAVIRNVEGLTDEQARWTPDGQLISPLGVMNHLTHVEWRWIDGGMRGAEVSRRRSRIPAGSGADRRRRARGVPRAAEATDAAVRSMSLTDRCRSEEGTNLRWVLLHLINETAPGTQGTPTRPENCSTAPPGSDASYSSCPRTSRRWCAISCSVCSATHRSDRSHGAG